MKNKKGTDSYWDRPLLSIIRFPLYYFFAMPILAIVNWLIYGLKIEGRQHLKALDKAVFVCNHMHYLDSTMIVLSTFPRQVVFFSQKSNFHLPIAGSILRLTGSLPLGSSYSEILKFQKIAAQKAAAGVWLGIFPEGNLEPYNNTLQPFKKGAFLIAREAGVPILPLVITQRPVRGFRRFYRRKPLLTIIIGIPISPPQTADKKADVDALCGQTYSRMLKMMEKPAALQWTFSRVK